MTRQDIKAKAKLDIKGNIGTYFLCNLIFSLITVAASPIMGASIILAPVFSMSFSMMALSMVAGEKIEVGSLFKGFNIFGKALWLYIITAFFTSLWSMLLIVPGIIKMLSYSMAPYILAENPDMTAREALNESKRITKGHVGEIFVMGLSFIGWMLLVVPTFGLIMIWLQPYMNTANANLYHKLSSSADGYINDFEDNPTTAMFDDGSTQASPEIAQQPVQRVAQQQVQKPVQSAAPKATAVSGKINVGLTCAAGDYVGVTFPLDAAEPIIIGRDPKLSSIVINNPLISGRHVGIRFDASKKVYYVRDFSANGTWVNNIRLESNVERPFAGGSLLKLVDDNTLFLLN